MPCFLRSLAISCLMLCSTVYAAKINAETLLFYDDFWPFTYTEEEHNKGLYFDLATTVFKSMDVDYKVETYPFKRALILAMEGKGVVVGVFKTDERALKLDFSKPFYQEESVLFVNKQNAFPFHTISDLKGKRIGVKLGWSYGDEFDQAKENNLFTVTAGSTEQLYQLLSLGRLDAVVDNNLSGLATIHDLKMNQDIKALPQQLVLGGIHIAVKKNTNTELINTFNQHVLRVKESGEYEKLLAKYYDLANSGTRPESP